MVIGFSGKIGSGKSTLSTTVAEDLRFLYSSFGSYVRKVATTRNIPFTRINLQDLGQELLSRNIHDFCIGVLNDANWSIGKSIVIDGIRHIEVIHELNRIVSPDSVKLVYLDISDEAIRKSRISNRESDITSSDKHTTENQIQDNSLMQTADLVVNSEKPIDVLCSEIVSWAKGLRL
jgi:dephospho-CoA kinase